MDAEPKVRVAWSPRGNPAQMRAAEVPGVRSAGRTRLNHYPISPAAVSCFDGLSCRYANDQRRQFAVLTLNHRTRLFGVVLVALACCAPAVAEDYPSRPVTLIIIPFPAGGGVDTIGRVIAAKLTAALGQQVIVENRAGAGSVIGICAAAKASPDGYTILMATTGAGVPANPGYDIIKDFAPIGLIASIPITVQANPAAPVNSLSDIVAMAKKMPGGLRTFARGESATSTIVRQAT
jgi:tripartite-type tricarboxylate transporter receptor subunit TctC